MVCSYWKDSEETDKNKKFVDVVCKRTYNRKESTFREMCSFTKDRQLFNIIRFKLPFKAVGKGSVRSSNGRFYIDSKTRAYMSSVAKIAGNYIDGVIAEPCSVRIFAVFERPKYASKVRKRDNTPTHPTTWLKYSAKPDADNIAKALLDALSPFMVDDSLVHHLKVEKVYSRLLKGSDDVWRPEPSSVYVQIAYADKDEQKIQAYCYKLPAWAQHIEGEDNGKV